MNKISKAFLILCEKIHPQSMNELLLEHGEKVLKYWIDKLSYFNFPQYMLIQDLNSMEKLHESAKKLRCFKGIFTSLLEAFTKIKEKYICILSWQFPHVDLEVLNLLFSIDGDYSAIVPRWPDGKVEAFLAVYNREKYCINTFLEKLKSLTKFEQLLKIAKPLYIFTEVIKSLDPNFNSFKRITKFWLRSLK